MGLHIGYPIIHNVEIKDEIQTLEDILCMDVEEGATWSGEMEVEEVEMEDDGI